ncbi:protein SpAN-like [Palaemon carinicauda]|uniref:protein SpAN-like n=1 Tax=Palaemon carinicauda TaxID=392227 RepID=UPI0035B5FC1F
MERDLWIGTFGEGLMGRDLWGGTLGEGIEERDGYDVSICKKVVRREESTAGSSKRFDYIRKTEDIKDFKTEDIKDFKTEDIKALKNEDIKAFKRKKDTDELRKRDNEILKETDNLMKEDHENWKTGENSEEEPLMPESFQQCSKRWRMFQQVSNGEITVCVSVKADGLEWMNPSHVNGQELFEGDILLTPEQSFMLQERKAVDFVARRWLNGPDGFPLVRYTFQDENVDQEAVNEAMNHWMEGTCIKFQKTFPGDLNPHIIFHKGFGCWSYIGMLKQAGQLLSIGSGCEELGTVAHEIGHSLGFFHEQSRSDRDNYVHINIDNVLPGATSNFKKITDNNYSIEYDFSSDMHYGARSFTLNGKLTIATINPLAQELIGQRRGLSHYDKLLANRMYSCIDKWLQNCKLPSDPCKNGGYIGANCACVCRPGTSGRFCEVVSQGYYDSLLSGCSENITTERPITSPNYPYNYPAAIKCVKWIQAPICHLVRIIFKSFEIYGRSDYCRRESCCFFELLEIRTTNLFDGEIYCGTDISPGSVFTSKGNQMILYFVTKTNAYPGWSANVTFIPDPGCTTNISTTTGESTDETHTSTISYTSSTTTSSTSTLTSNTPTKITSTYTTTQNVRPLLGEFNCTTEVINSTSVEWTSPLFGLSNYPDETECLLTLSSLFPAWAKMTLNEFALQQPNERGQCLDRVVVQKPFNLGQEVLCGLMPGKIIHLPTYNFQAKFSSDEMSSAAGFNITISQETSECHKVFTVYM